MVCYVTEETNSEIDVEKKALLKTCGKEKNGRHLPETRNKFTGRTAKKLSGTGDIEDGPICWFCPPPPEIGLLTGDKGWLLILNQGKKYAGVFAGKPGH